MNEKQADTLLNVPEIVKRAKIALNLKRDSELASYLGVARATLSNWCARNSIDFPVLLKKLRHVDDNWLLTGKGSPLHDPKSFDNGKIRGEVETIHNSKTTEAIDDRSVTLYDITAAANLRTLLSDKRQYALGKILIPSIPACDGAIFVNGDSMYPILKSGDIVPPRSAAAASSGTHRRRLPPRPGRGPALRAGDTAPGPAGWSAPG